MTTRDSYRGELEQVIAQQIRRYRLGANMTLGTLADLAGISKAMLSKIENAQTSFSLTTLSGLAQALEVPVTALLRGADGEREPILVRAGEGAIVRRSGGGDGHEYRHLGELNDDSHRMVPLLVTLETADQARPSFQHPGSELIHMLEGRMVYTHGASQFELAPGDTLQFDGESPHGVERVIEAPVRFLSVTLASPYLDPS